MSLDPLALSTGALLLIAGIGVGIALLDDRRWYRWARRRVSRRLLVAAERRARRRLARDLLPAKGPSELCRRGDSGEHRILRPSR